jgi:hypothetical protein
MVCFLEINLKMLVSIGMERALKSLNWASDIMKTFSFLKDIACMLPVR